MAKIGRNEPCPCGSGKKYKVCHMGQKEAAAKDMKIPSIIMMVGAVAGVGIAVTTEFKFGAVAALLGVLVAGAVAVFRDPPSSKGDGGSPASINFGN